MQTYTLAEAKSHFSQVVCEAEAGNRILITRHGKPAAVVCAPESSPKTIRDMQGFVIEEMKGWQMPDDFDRLTLPQ
jgi:prevent-host-death family protein